LGDGPATEDLFARIRDRGGLSDPVLRERAAKIYSEMLIARYMRQESSRARVGGRDPGALGSLVHALSAEHAQHVMELAKDLEGAHGMLGTQVPDSKNNDTWHWGFLFSRGLTIGGGTSQILRNILAEQVLGLPREPR
jgi:alkylation response protein AidB-like acyl-CoA dehydrogenase